MKKIKLLVVFIVAFFFTITNVNAEIEVNRLTSIIGKYNYSDVNITDTNVYLYKIADMSELAKYTYVDEFVGYTEDVNTLESFEWDDYTSKLNKYISDNNINYIASTKTDSNGEFTFKDLKVGLYLIRVDSKKTEDYEYSSGPLLVSLPNFNEIQDVYMYDLSVFAKTEAKSLNVNPGDGGVDPPYTADTIYLYVAIFGIALIIFIVAIVLIIKKKKNNKKTDAGSMDVNQIDSQVTTQSDNSVINQVDNQDNNQINNQNMNQDNQNTSSEG